MNSTNSSWIGLIDFDWLRQAVMIFLDLYLYHVYLDLNLEVIFSFCYYFRISNLCD